MLRFTRLLAVVLVLSAPALAADWPHPRGPHTDGRLAAPGTFESDQIGLNLAWRVGLGSGYSAIAIGSGHVVTLFSDGKSDWAAALDATTGKEQWRYRLSDVTKGVDGADDGPLSSPVIGEGLAYAIGSRGELVALSLKKGELKWTRNLATDFGSEAPSFGFTTTPVLVGKTLIVQAGGVEGKSIVGLDATTGTTRWTLGNDKVAYQSPAVMTLAGSEQVIAIGDKHLSGVDAATGKVLWNHALGEGDRAGTATPVFMGDDRFIVGMSGGGTAYRVAKTDAGYAVEELYRTQEMGNNYAPPVYHDGFMYGFRGQVLTCFDASTGERAWRSRPPGGDGLILVDRHLVIFGSKGAVVVADASPKGYVERARIQALEGSSLTWPSFADGRVFVRNLDEIAAVAVSHRKTAVPVASAAELDTEFGRWVQSVESSENASAKVEEVFQRHATFPIVEGDHVHFVFRTAAQDVAIAGSMLDSEAAAQMRRIKGTDVFYRTFPLEPGLRWEYRFQTDFETWVPDPQNPRTTPQADGSDLMSEFVAPGYVIPAHVQAAVGPAGRVDEFKLQSEILGYEKDIKVWLPPGYDESKSDYPVLIVNDGAEWIAKGDLPNTLNNLVGTQVEPLIAVFVPSFRRWWEEAGGSRTGDYAKMQAEELFPALKERYRIRSGAGAHGVMGTRFYAISAAYTALKYPELFGRVAMQSANLGLGVTDEVTALIRQPSGKKPTFYLDWNRYDERNVDRGYDFADDSRELQALLRQGGFTTQGGEVADSRGWSGWRNRSDQALTALFPGQ